jgi:hypothetical protein
MRVLRFSATCALAFGLGACSKEGAFEVPLPPLAAIHWVNAVPDTGEQDIRVVDIVTNAGLYDANFRGSTMFYQPIEAGSRTVRIFNSSTDPAVAQTVIGETTLALTANTNYTFIHTGFARGGPPARQGLLVQDTPPTPAAGQVAVRVIHAGAGMAAVDVHLVRAAVNPATADSLPDTPTIAGLTYGNASTYVSLAADGAGQALRAAFTTAGTKTVLATVNAPVGTAGSTTVNPIAGATQAGSVMSAVLFAPSVAGSAATTFGTPGAAYLVDRRPPNTAP